MTISPLPPSLFPLDGWAAPHLGFVPFFLSQDGCLLTVMHKGPNPCVCWAVVSSPDQSWTGSVARRSRGSALFFIRLCGESFLCRWTLSFLCVCVCAHARRSALWWWEKTRASTHWEGFLGWLHAILECTAKIKPRRCINKRCNLLTQHSSQTWGTVQDRNLFVLSSGGGGSSVGCDREIGK